MCDFFPDSDHSVSLPASSSVVAGTSAAEEDSKKDAPTNKASEADPNKDVACTSAKEDPKQDAQTNKASETNPNKDVACTRAMAGLPSWLLSQTRTRMYFAAVPRQTRTRMLLLTRQHQT